jgi:hypothetical protein
MKAFRLRYLTILLLMAAPATYGAPLVRQRPVLSGPELLRSKTHVLVHYTTSGRDSTAPAFAESVAVYSESAWVRIARYGWAMPAPDQGYGGDDRMDVYVRSVNVVAASFPDSAYTNPYPDGYSCYHQYNCSLAMNEWLKWVGTHETHHSVQGRYESGSGRWSYENMSNYAVRKVFPDCWEVFDWSFDAISPLSTPWLSINHQPTSDNYVGGGALFWLFLDEYYGADTPRRIWDLRGRHAGEHTFPDIDSVLRTDYSSSLAKALGHYAIWRYFTGTRADGLHFDYAESLQTCVVHARHTTFPASGSQGTHGPRGPGGFCPVEFVNSSDQDLTIIFNGQDGYGWRVYVLAIRDGEVREQLMTLNAVNYGTIQIPAALAQTAVLLPVVVHATTDSDSTPALTFTYSASLADAAPQAVIERPLDIAGIGAIYPNPASSGTTIYVTLPVGAPGLLTIADAAGRLVRRMDIVGAGRPQAVRWRRDEDAGRRVPNGLYVCRLATDGEAFRLKLVVR